MKVRHFTSKALCILMVLAVALTNITFVNAANSSDVTTIVACSDFQNNEGPESGRVVVEGLVDTLLDNGVPQADGFFCCGDYGNGYGTSTNGINALTEGVKDIATENMIFVQGNHDAEIGTQGISLSGNHDHPDGKYGVFVINEDDYPWFNGDQEIIKHTAQNLAQYLNEKIATGYSKPIFVLSHLHLHFNMRTVKEGDGAHGKYIFDVLNEAGEKGLNIIFIYGHNHANGWDDYLGGAAVFLKKGDSIQIAQNSRAEFETEKLNFTYMNAGFVGYYANENQSDDALTMTTFSITDKDVLIKRYDKDGLHNLKSKGVTNTFKGEEEYYGPNEDIYTSPQTIELTEVTDVSPLKNVVDVTGKKYVKINSLSEITSDNEYLLLHNGQLMIPQVFAKNDNSGVQRSGCNLIAATGVTEDTVFGEFTDNAWILSTIDGGWKLSNSAGKFVRFDAAVKTNVKVKVSNLLTPDAFTIACTDGVFTFTNGTYYLSYSDAGVIYGQTNNPAEFEIYKHVGYAIDVDNGFAYNTSGNIIYGANIGDTITVSAQKTFNGKPFEKWLVTSKNVTLADETSDITTFTMPDGTVTLTAVYGAAEEEVTYGDINGDGIINVNDAVLLVEYIGTIAAGGKLDETKFPNGTFPGGETSAKLTADDVINVNDAVLLVEYIGTIAAGGILDETKFPNGNFPGADN